MATQELISEEDLIVRLRDPKLKRAAFETVAHLHSRRVYWQIRRMVMNHDDADDLVQNTFLKAWTGIEGFRGDARLSTWLYRIAMYESLAFLKQRKASKDRQVEITNDNEYLVEQLSADIYFDGNAVEAAFVAAIASLPDKQRLVFNMRYFDEMPYADIAEVTGTSEGALKASYHHAMKKLHRFLIPED